MNIVLLKETTAKELGLEQECKIYCLSVEIDNTEERVGEVISRINNTSWVGGLDVIDKVAFEARAAPTVAKLVTKVLKVWI